MQKKDKSELVGTKITSSRLVPIQTKSIFEKHVNAIVCDQKPSTKYVSRSYPSMARTKHVKTIVVQPKL